MKQILKFCRRSTQSFSEKVTQNTVIPNIEIDESISGDPCDEMTVVEKFTTQLHHS